MKEQTDNELRSEKPRTREEILEILRQPKPGRWMSPSLRPFEVALLVEQSPNDGMTSEGSSADDEWCDEEKTVKPSCDDGNPATPKTCPECETANGKVCFECRSRVGGPKDTCKCVDADGNPTNCPPLAPTDPVGCRPGVVRDFPSTAAGIPWCLGRLPVGKNGLTSVDNLSVTLEVKPCYKLDRERCEWVEGRRICIGSVSFELTIKVDDEKPAAMADLNKAYGHEQRHAREIIAAAHEAADLLEAKINASDCIVPDGTSTLATIENALNAEANVFRGLVDAKFLAARQDSFDHKGWENGPYAGVDPVGEVGPVTACE